MFSFTSNPEDRSAVVCELFVNVTCEVEAAGEQSSKALPTPPASKVTDSLSRYERQSDLTFM